MIVWISFTSWAHPPLLPDIAGFQLRHGESGGHGFRAARQYCVINWQCYIYFFSLHITHGWMHKSAIDEWFRMLYGWCGALWSSWLPSCSFVSWQWMSVAFLVAIFPIHSYVFGGVFCSVGFQKRHADDKLGLIAEWGLSKLCCIRSDEKRQALTDRTK